MLRHAFFCPRFSVLFFSWTSNQRGRHSKTFQHFLSLPWKTMSCRLFFKISLGKELFFSSCFVSFKMSFSTFPPFSRASPWHRTASVFHLYAKHPIEVQSLSSGFELKDKKILLCFTSTCKKMENSDHKTWHKSDVFFLFIISDWYVSFGYEVKWNIFRQKRLKWEAIFLNYCDVRRKTTAKCRRDCRGNSL